MTSKGHVRDHCKIADMPFLSLCSRTKLYSVATVVFVLVGETNNKYIGIFKPQVSILTLVLPQL